MQLLSNNFIEIKQTLANIDANEFVAFDSYVKNIDFPYFKGDKKISNVKIKKNITHLCPFLFEGSTLKYIEITTTDMDILSDNVFYACKELHEFNAGKSTIKYIDKSCFDSCHKLLNVILPKTLISLGDACFHGCKSLQHIILPQSITNTGKSCFDSCHKLNSIVLPKNLKDLQMETFADCIALQNIDLMQIQQIGFNCFSRCKQLKKIIIPSSIKYIDDFAFAKSGLEEITFQHSIDDNIDFGNCIFADCKNLKTINGNNKIKEKLHYNLECI